MYKHAWYTTANGQAKICEKCGKWSWLDGADGDCPKMGRIVHYDSLFFNKIISEVVPIERDYGMGTSVVRSHLESETCEYCKE